jgi:hypothetical protein
MSESIQHFDGSHVHGPVHTFLSDQGRIAFVCAVDQAAWEAEMPLVKPPRPSGTEGDHQEGGPPMSLVPPNDGVPVEDQSSSKLQAESTADVIAILHRLWPNS